MTGGCIEFTNQWIKDYATRRLVPEIIEYKIFS
jgi:hypothetical protein